MLSSTLFTQLRHSFSLLFGVFDPFLHKSFSHHKQDQPPPLISRPTVLHHISPSPTTRNIRPPRLPTHHAPPIIPHPPFPSTTHHPASSSLPSPSTFTSTSSAPFSQPIPKPPSHPTNQPTTHTQQTTSPSQTRTCSTSARPHPSVPLPTPPDPFPQPHPSPPGQTTNTKPSVPVQCAALDEWSGQKRRGSCAGGRVLRKVR